MLLRGVALVHILKLERRLIWRIGYLHDILVAHLAKPTRLVVTEHLCGLGGLPLSDTRHRSLNRPSTRVRTYLEVLAPFIENLLQHAVDVGVQEGCMAAGCTHGI